MAHKLLFECGYDPVKAVEAIDAAYSEYRQIVTQPLTTVLVRGPFPCARCNQRQAVWFAPNTAGYCDPCRGAVDLCGGPHQYWRPIVVTPLQRDPPVGSAAGTESRQSTE